MAPNEPNSSTRHEIARRTLDIIPLIMRVMSAEIRHAHSTVLPGHLPLLGMLRYRQHTLSELADRMSVSPSTMSNTVNALEERGWVARTRDQHDRRVVWVAITEAGLAILAQVNGGVAERLTALLSKLSDEEAAAVADGLAVLRDVFNEAIDGDPHL